MHRCSTCWPSGLGSAPWSSTWQTYFRLMPAPRYCFAAICFFIFKYAKFFTILIGNSQQYSATTFCKRKNISQCYLLKCCSWSFLGRVLQIENFKGTLNPGCCSKLSGSNLIKHTAVKLKSSTLKHWYIICITYQCTALQIGLINFQMQQLVHHVSSRSRASSTKSSNESKS